MVLFLLSGILLTFIVFSLPRDSPIIMITAIIWFSSMICVGFLFLTISDIGIILGYYEKVGYEHEVTEALST